MSHSCTPPRPALILVELKRRKPQGPQTKVQQPRINITMHKQFAKDGAKISQLTPCEEGLEKAHAAANVKAFNPRQFAGIVIIEQDFIGMDFFRRQDGADFSKT